MSDVPRLLPPNSTPAEFAMEQATARIGAVPTPARTLWDPNTCPVNLLPWLAWTYSVDRWDRNWTEAVKRQAIRDSIEIHRRKGTVASLKRAIEALGYSISFVEWWQSEGSDLDPHEFRATVDTSGLGLTLEQSRIVFEIIDSTKPLRSHMADIAFSELIHPAEAYVGAVPFDGAYSYHVAEIGALPLPGIPDGSLALVGETAPYSIWQYQEDIEEWFALLVYADELGDLPTDVREGALALVGTDPVLEAREVYVWTGAAWLLAGEPRALVSSLLAGLPAASGVKVGTVGVVGDAPTQELHISDGLAWVASLLYRAASGDLPATARPGALALVGTGSPLRNRDAYLFDEDDTWHQIGRGNRAISDIYDVAANDRDGDFGILTTPNGPIALRLKLACPVAGGGTRPVWMSHTAYSLSPVLWAWCDGTEALDATLIAQGFSNPIPVDVGASRTPIAGFQRLTGGSGVAARLRTALGSVSSTTRVEILCQARTDVSGTSDLAYVALIGDGTNVLCLKQGETSGFGFGDTAFGAIQNTPPRNGIAGTLPNLASAAAWIMLRDEGRAVMSDVKVNGQHWGDYHRVLQANAFNGVQISCQGSSSLDFRGQVLFY